MSREDVELVRRAYEAWNRGEPERAIELLAPDVAWHLPAHFPDAESWHGREAVVRGIEEMAAGWQEIRVEVHELIDAGDRVVALVRYRGRAAITGLELAGAGVDAQVWTLRDGLAVDVQMYSGADEALSAVRRGRT